MKQLFFTILTMTCLNSFAVINDINDNNKTINFTPTNSLEINLTLANVDNNNYGILSYNWYINYQMADAEIAGLKGNYPNYVLNRKDLEAVNDVSLNIPMANFSVALNPLHSQNGFYAEDNVILNRKQYLDILNAMSSSPTSYATMSGLAHTHIDVISIIEQKVLSPNICQKLLGNGTLGDVMTNIFMYGGDLEKDQDLKNDQTKKLFISAIKNSCFSIQTSTVNSVKDLLNTKMTSILSENKTVSFTKTNSEPIDLKVPFKLTSWTGNK